jgi:putative phosphoesterase
MCMKLAILSDIHSNLEALDAVLADIEKRGIKHIIVAGDIVGYGPNPNECIQRLRKTGAMCVRGNHDDQAVKMDDIDWFNDFAKVALIWTSKHLTETSKAWLSKLPLIRKVGNIFVVHGSPLEPLKEYVYENDPLEKHVDSVNMPIIVMGQTHIPYARFVNKTLVINPGSVGQPRDRNPNACYCVLDNDSLKAEIVRIRYDIDAVEKKMKKAGLPAVLAGRLHYGK